MHSILKLIAIYFIRFFMRIFYVFPVKKGRIIFNSYRGSQYSCNPKYISEELEKTRNDIEIIWAFKQVKEYEFLRKRGIKVVKYTSLQRFYYEATAEYSINNVGSFSWLPLRNGQHHINTWHGGGCYKKAGLGETVTDNVYKKTQIMTAKETSEFVSSSRFSTDNIIPNDFGYHGEILNIGLPRNDIMFSDKKMEIRKKVLKELGIKEDNFIVLYAPTWRYDMYEEIQTPDFKMIKNVVNERFETKTTVLFRAHPNLKSTLKGEFLDVSLYPDMQELLVASDMLISDYSSCIWDYSFLYRPCILYVPDLKAYSDERGFVIDIFEWGFPVAENNEALREILQTYTSKDIKAGLKKHHADLGSFEDGTACKTICSIICQG